MLCGAVFCRVPPRCVLWAVGVLSWRAGACCCSPLRCVLCVSPGVVLCVACLLRSVRCCVLFCWCAYVVLFVWCVLLLAPGAVVRCRVLCFSLWCSVVRCWVWRPVVVCWLCPLVSVSLSRRVVCFPVVGVFCCGALFACVVFCGAVLSRGAVLLGSAVVLRCCLCLLCPPVACRAVLCCVVGCLRCFVPCGGVCVLWCSFPICQHAQNKLIMTLYYSAPISQSLGHVVEESCLAIRRFVLDPRGCLRWSPLVLSWRACSETQGKNGEGGAEKGRGGTWRKENKSRGRGFRGVAS